MAHEIITRNESDVKIDVICVESGGLQLVIANAFIKCANALIRVKR